jgi:hypothetical protein
MQFYILDYFDDSNTVPSYIMSLYNTGSSEYIAVYDHTNLSHVVDIARSGFATEL